MKPSTSTSSSDVRTIALWMIIIGGLALAFSAPEGFALLAVGTVALILSLIFGG